MIVIRELDRLRAISDDLRYRLFRILAQSRVELCVAELVDIVQAPQYGVSRALQRLRQAEIVEERRDGRMIYYRAASDLWVRRASELVLIRAENDPRWNEERDRIRWRLEIRSDGVCVVTYPSDRAEKRTRVLFICVHNTARSQIAEAYLRRMLGESIFVESAGLEPGELNPYVIRVLAEQGIDIRSKQPRSVFDLYRAGHLYDYVITVCSRKTEEMCPAFPGSAIRFNWPFEDPQTYTGSDAEIMRRVRALAATIEEKIAAFVETYRLRHVQGGHDGANRSNKASNSRNLHPQQRT